MGNDSGLRFVSDGDQRFGESDSYQKVCSSAHGLARSKLGTLVLMDDLQKCRWQRWITMSRVVIWNVHGWSQPICFRKSQWDQESIFNSILHGFCGDMFKTDKSHLILSFGSDRKVNDTNRSGTSKNELLLGLAFYFVCHGRAVNKTKSHRFKCGLCFSTLWDCQALPP